MDGKQILLCLVPWQPELDQNETQIDGDVNKQCGHVKELEMTISTMIPGCFLKVEGWVGGGLGWFDGRRWIEVGLFGGCVVGVWLSGE